MASTSTVTRNYYKGNGSSAIYSYTFKLLSASDLKVLKRLLNETVVVLVEGTDYSISGIGQSSGGSITLTAGNLPVDVELALIHNPPFYQESSFVNHSKFFPERHEASFDRGVQYSNVLRDQVDRSLKFSDFDGSKSPILPKPVADTVIGFDEKGNLTLKTPAEIAEQAGGGLPPGGDPGSVLTTDIDGSSIFKQYSYEGYSARFGANFSSTDLDDTLAKILNLQYAGPAVSLSASGSSTVREKGTAVTSVTLTATITKRSNPIAAVIFKKDGTTIYTDPSPPANGGTSSYVWTGSFSDNATFSVEVTDTTETGGGPTTASASSSFTFVYPYFYGAGASGLTPAQVAALTKDVIVSSATLTRTLAATAGQYTYFAYPASYGALTSILDVNGFEVLPSWTGTTGNITGLDTTSQSYRIYKGNNALSAGSYQFTFKR